MNADEIEPRGSLGRDREAASLGNMEDFPTDIMHDIGPEAMAVGFRGYTFFILTNTPCVILDHKTGFYEWRLPFSLIDVTDMV